MLRCRLLALALAAAAVAPAWALEEDVWTFTVGAGEAWDDNLLRLPNNISPQQAGVGDRPRASWITNAYARVAFDKPVSRQHFRGYAQGNAFWYSGYGYLDWTGLDFNGTWVWEAGNRWNGTLAFTQTQALSGLSDFRALTQNILTVDTARATAEYWLHPRWRLTGGYTGTFSKNSSDALSGNDLNQNAYGLGFKFVSTSQNYIIFGARYTQGDYPNRRLPTPIADNAFTQYDAGVDLSWGLGGNAELLGNVAYTKRELANISNRDFAGPTGNLKLNWRTSGKTGINALLSRGIGAVEDVTANYIVTDTARVAPYWLVTAKVRLDAWYQYQRRDYSGEPVVLGIPQREDRYNYVGTGATWLPTRNWQLGLNYVWSTRASNYPTLDFNDNTVSATVQFQW